GVAVSLTPIRPQRVPVLLPRGRASRGYGFGRGRGATWKNARFALYLLAWLILAAHLPGPDPGQPVGLVPRVPPVHRPLTEHHHQTPPRPAGSLLLGRGVPRASLVRPRTSTPRWCTRRRCPRTATCRTSPLQPRPLP